MNLLVIQILAVGLTISQLFTKPVDQFKTSFDPFADQGEVTRLLTEGCAFSTKELKTDKISLNDFFNMILDNFKNAQAREAAAKEAAKNTPVAADEPAKLSPDSFLDRIDIAQSYAAYRQFCGGEIVENSPIKLEEVIAYYNKTLADLPDHTKLKNFKLPGSSLVLDRDGKRFTEIYSDNNRRKWISIDEMPAYLPKAFVSAEDKRFYEHHGIDIRGIIRAFSTSLASHKRPEGGSTITQQVVKNLLTGDDVKMERKIREMVLSARLETALTKKEILELYLNYVFMGRSSWGVAMAAESYFGKSVKQLTVSESAILAALTRGPGTYNADLHPEKLEDRRLYVLSRMKDDHPEDNMDMAKLAAEKIKTVAFESPRARAAFYFLDEIQRDAKSAAGIPSLTANSYVVRSTIQRDLQKSAEKALQDGLADYEIAAGRTPSFEIEGSLADEIAKLKNTWQEALPKRHGKLWDIQWPLATVIDTGNTLFKGRDGRNYRTGVIRVGLADGRVATLVNAGQRVKGSLKIYDLIRVQVIEGKSLTASVRVKPLVQGAIVVLEAKTGRVLAMSGGFSYAQSQLNRVTRTTRQVGSTLKPFIYLSALNLGFQPNTLIPNMPVNLEPIDRGGQWYSPHNYDRDSGGLVTIRQAVEQSLNLPTVRLMSEMGRTPMEGLDYIRGVTQELGIYQNPVRYYPFVLGAQPTRLLDMAVAYATIANIGMKPTPHFIDSIEQDGKLVYERPRFALKAIPSIDRVSFFQIRHILEGTVARGTATKLKDLTGYVAGKTGTTNNGNDAWFVGFTNDLVVAAWVGYDNTNIRSSLGGKFTGGKVALPIAEKV
ncbi:MAG: penicillin-binding protein 1A, partial [Bdellovibrionales bacterium]